MNETSLRRRIMKLYTPAVSDTLDEMGYINSVLDNSIKPLKRGYRIAGPVITAHTTVLESYTSIKIEEWLQVVLPMLEAAKEGSIYVVETGGNKDIASWGELMSNSARAKGAVGIITDGAVRDTPKILEIKPPFQVFSASKTPKDAKGRLVFTSYNEPIKCGGVEVNPGDFAFADDDGVVIIPKEIIEEVVSKAERRVKNESAFRVAVKNGMSVTKAFQKYRVF